MTRIRDPSSIARELRDAFDQKGMNPTDIGREVKLNQSQVYRALHDNPKTVSKTMKVLCDYANISYMEAAPDPSQSPTLMSAIAELWDGSEAHACRIADAIFALKRLRM